MSKVTMDKIVSLCKSRGLIFPGSDIYGGLANTWDYGPIGVELVNNIKNAWWKVFIQSDPMNVGLDSGILLNPEVWVASGHVGGFSDPLIDCKDCKTRYRADHLIEDHSGGTVPVDGMSNEELENYIKEHNIKCPNCGKNNFTEIRQFNLMFKTSQGVVASSSTDIYLRPETAQGIFINFKAVQRSMRKKLPFGIGQIGKSFRNEITPGNFIFRTREFEQMELEFFCKEGTDLEWFDTWRNRCMDFLIRVGVDKNRLRFRDHSQEELSHYSKATTDIEFEFSFGWGEIWGIAHRSDYDLKAHSSHANTDLSYQDPITNEKFIPFCIEPSVGVGRLFITILASAYDEEQLEDGTTRTVLHLHPAIAPYKAAVLPLMKKLNDDAYKVYEMLSSEFNVDYDESGNIGKRYRRQDEIGTPFCITFDFDSLEDKMVTVRERDSMEQTRVAISELNSYLREKTKL